MTDSRHTSAGLPSSQPLPEPSLETLALAEMLAEMRAAGAAPRLSELIAALPEAAVALADATMAESDEYLTGQRQRTDEDRPSTQPTHLSPGAQQAVASIFHMGDAIALGEQWLRPARDDAPARVAEATAQYSVSWGEAEGLLALARRQGFDAEALAAHVMLSSEALCWLDRVALPLEHQPDVLVFHLAGALGVPCERVQLALAQGETVIDLAGFMSTFATGALLTPMQRDYWLALISSNR